MPTGSTPDYRGLAGTGAGGDQAASEAGAEEGEAIISVRYFYLLSSHFQVRWADIEQRKTQERVAQFGFVVGQTNWASQEDRESAASSALTATKIIPSRWHSEFHN